MHSIASNVLFDLAGFPVTNTMLAALLTTFTILGLAVIIRVKLSIRPGTLQAFFELIYEYIENLCITISDKQRAAKFLPWILGFFLFILVSNYWGLVPIFGDGIVLKNESAGHHEEIAVETLHDAESNTVESEESHELSEFPLLKGATSDPNTTFALSVVSLALVIGFGLTAHNPIGLLKHYMQFSALKTLDGIMRIALLPIFIFVGILEILLEPLKSISLSFRLFGNIFAGETLVKAMTILNGVAIPIAAAPFLILEIIVGAIQALVFSVLSLVFMSIITEKH